MEISDVHVKLIRNSSDRLKAVCTITFDSEFVVRDVKVVEGTNGMFVAMPSRKLSVHCKSCNQKNHLRSKYCNECGSKIDSKPPPSDTDGRTRLHRDIAHPITPAFRERVQEHVIKAYEDEYESVKDSQEVEEEPLEAVEDSQEIEEEDDYESTTSKSPKKGSGFEEYDEIIASLKGSQKTRTEKKLDATNRASENDTRNLNEIPERITSSFLDEEDNIEIVSSNEEIEPSTVTNYDQQTESLSPTSSIDIEDEGAFGEGIL